MEGNWVIAGSPAMGSAGTWVPTLTVSDALGASAQGFVEIDVHDIESSYVTIVNNSLPSARESEPYGPVTIVASGGTQPYFVEAEGLPYGIELVEGESGEWLLTGVAGAASAGVYAVTVTLSDSSVPPLSDEDVLMLSVQSSAETSDAGAPESPVFPSVSLLTPPAACALHSGAGLSVGLGFFASLASCAFRRRKRLP
ncbi:MAG: hypothetical protein L6Q71_07885, partial [Planctomycetes bacterium]|nr:hypothetical protein [Planctomycetota bacterium]